MINPHPETTPSTFSRTPIPNQRHQDWASGHAIGRSEGIREGQEASDRIHSVLHGMSVQALKTLALMGGTEDYGSGPGSLSHTLSLLEDAAAEKGE